MKRPLYCLPAIALTLAAPTAFAQVSVIGGGIASECYRAAKFETVSPKEGEKICTRAITYEAMQVSNRAATYTNRGVLRMRAGKYQAALDDYRLAKQIKPEIGETYLNEGAAFIFMKDFNSALESLNKAIEYDSGELQAAYYNRAIAREKLGDLEGAYGDFQKALELKPDWELAQWQLSRFTVETN